MARKAQLGWRSELEDGVVCEKYAEKIGDRWQFFYQRARYEDWLPLTDPPLEDWMILLGLLRKRIERQWFKPEEEKRLRTIIKEHFPRAVFDEE